MPSDNKDKDKEKEEKEEKEEKVEKKDKKEEKADKKEKKDDKSDKGDDDEKEEKKPAPKKRGAPKKKPAAADDDEEEAKRDHPQRNRTKTTQYQHDSAPEGKSTSLSITQGAGDELGDIPNVNTLLTKEKDGTTLQLLHRLCFKSAGKKTTQRRNLRQFSGLPADQKDSTRDRVARLTLPKLRAAAKVFDCKPDSGEKDDYIDAISKFLMKPKASGKPLRSASPKPKKKASKRKASKSSKGGKKRKKDPDAPKRPTSAYLLFSNDQRGAVKKKHPSYTVADIAKKLGAKWNGLSEAEKKPYAKEAKKDKERYEREMAAYKKKGKKKSKGKKKQEESESESEEESGEESGSGSGSDSAEESEEEETPKKKGVTKRQKKMEDETKKRKKAASDSEDEEETPAKKGKKDDEESGEE